MSRWEDECVETSGTATYILCARINGKDVVVPRDGKGKALARMVNPWSKGKVIKKRKAIRSIASIARCNCIIHPRYWCQLEPTLFTPVEW